MNPHQVLLGVPLLLLIVAFFYHTCVLRVPQPAAGAAHHISATSHLSVHQTDLFSACAGTRSRPCQGVCKPFVRSDAIHRCDRKADRLCRLVGANFFLVSSWWRTFNQNPMMNHESRVNAVWSLLSFVTLWFSDSAAQCLIQWIILFTRENSLVLYLLKHGLLMSARTTVSFAAWRDAYKYLFDLFKAVNDVLHKQQHTMLLQKNNPHQSGLKSHFPLTPLRLALVITVVFTVYSSI